MNILSIMGSIMETIKFEKEYKKIKCTSCANGQAIPILYGKLMLEGTRACQLGYASHGGCGASDDAPTHLCTTCKFGMGKMSESHPELYKWLANGAN